MFYVWRVEDAQRFKTFYNAFSRKLLLDYLRPNERITLQRQFLREAIPKSARSVVFIGCGTGQVLAEVMHCAPHARWLGADLSPANVSLARRLFRGRQLTFIEHDILAGPIAGEWDVIVFPDSYEHLPREQYPRLFAHLLAMLSSSGRVLLSCPTPAHQATLRHKGTGLQPVDEDVQLADVQALAHALGAQVTHYSLVQVWNSFDYFHAEIARGAETQRSFRESVPTRLHRGRAWPQRLWSLALGQDGALRLPLRAARVARSWWATRDAHK